MGPWPTFNIKMCPFLLNKTLFFKVKFVVMPPPHSIFIPYKIIFLYREIVWPPPPVVGNISLNLLMTASLSFLLTLEVYFVLDFLARMEDEGETQK